jgi:fluoroquinolone transport system ATP-binding protein
MIDVSGLSFRYAGTADPAVRDISFGVGKGEILGFLGPSGAGKSTTQKILTGLLKGYGGKARVLGRDLKDWGSDFYEHIGVSFELPNHYRKLSGIENLNFFRSLFSVPTENPSKLLERVGLEDDARKPVAEYSKGMQMRLTFIRALLNRPKLLFLDEPTSGLDPANARNIKEMIREEKDNGATVFLTTHNMTVADELCDRVAFIVDGEIRLVGSPRALKIQHGRKVVRVEYREGGSIASQEFPIQSLASDPRFIEIVRTKQVETIHTLEATLEDIFIACTGRSLS